MRFKNTSRYADAEVRALVEFAMRGVDTTGVAVNVKNSRRAYRGTAYERVPHCSPLASKAQRLITIGIGAPDRFPKDNLMTTWKRHPRVPFAQRVAVPEGWRFRVGVEAGRQWFELLEPVRHPYGGQRSPLIDMADWREALVAVAAHEARHIWQYQHNKPRSEVDCERFAARRLAEYRQQQEKR